MNARVDLHILTHGSMRGDWLSACLKSLENEPVTIHIIDNNDRCIGDGRIHGFSTGSAEFVVSVDSDDALLPGAIQACIDALDANPDAVAAFTDHIIVDENLIHIRPGVSTGTGRWDIKKMPWLGGYCEHICVFRRNAVLPFLHKMTGVHVGACHLLRGCVAGLGDFVHVERPGVLFRQHENNTHRTAKPADLMPIYAEIFETLRKAGRLPLHRIDAHVLWCHESLSWLHQCLASLSDEPVNVYLCDGIAGQVGKARALAFERGNAEYMSFVDGDDAVEPGCFDAALAVLDAQPGVVSTYCDVRVLDVDGQEVGNGYVKGPWRPWRQLWTLAEVHHCHVMRRDAVMPYLEELARWESLEEWVLMGLLARHGIHWHIPRKLYRFRQHGAYQRAGSLITAAMRQRGFDLCAAALIDLHRRGVRQPDHGA